MNNAIDDLRAVEEVIGFMRKRLSESLVLDDLARIANYSKFHFCRLFRDTTGITPGRFLSALRLQRSKHLLLSTDLNVCDVSCEVGYNSVGTFTSRFTRSVGIPPSVFRSAGGFRVAPAPHTPPEPRDTRPTDIEGHLIAPAGHRSERVLLAAMPTAIPEGRPRQCAVMPRPGDWRLPGVGEGTWYVGVVTIPPDEADDLSSPILEEHAQLVGLEGPITVSADGPPPEVVITLRPIQPTDPPILFAPPKRASLGIGSELGGAIDGYAG